MSANFSIAIDTEGNRYISLPFRPVQLPEWKECASINPCVEVTIADLQEVINAHKERNTHRVNEILGHYY